jgi:hypothetical protein
VARRQEGESVMMRYVARPNRRSRTYVLETSVIAAIDDLAQELNVYHSSIANLLLKRAIGEVKRGNWTLKAQPVAYDAAWGD